MLGKQYDFKCCVVDIQKLTVWIILYIYTYIHIYRE